MQGRGRSQACNPKLSPLEQAGEDEAAEAALQPAWGALEAAMHKAPEPDQAVSRPTGTPAACAASLDGGSPLDSGNDHGVGGARSGAAGLHAGCAWLMRFTAAWVFCAMGTAGVSLLEKQRRYEAACARLRLLLGGPANVRC